MASPRPSSGRPASIKASQIESPLRNEAGEEVNEAGEVIHIDPPAHRSSKIHGANYDAPTQDLGPEVAIRKRRVVGSPSVVMAPQFLLRMS
jgi:hypothetical protein